MKKDEKKLAYNMRFKLIFISSYLKIVLPVLNKG